MVAAKVRAKGYTVVNADMTIIAQAPKMAPYIPRMLPLIAEDLALASDALNIKATTTEHLGFTGRKEGIACLASVLISEI